MCTSKVQPFFYFTSFFDWECRCKGIVHQILKYHPFTTHHYVDDEIFTVHTTMLEFHWLKEFHPIGWNLMEFFWELVVAVGSNGRSNGKTQRVSTQLVRCHPSVLKTWQSNLFCDVTSCDVFGQNIHCGLLTRGRVHVSFCEFGKLAYRLVELAILARPHMNSWTFPLKRLASEMLPHSKCRCPSVQVFQFHLARGGSSPWKPPLTFLLFWSATFCACVW